MSMEMNMKYLIGFLLFIIMFGFSFSVTGTIFSDNLENTSRSNSIWTLGSGWSINVIDGMDKNSMYSLFDQNSNWDNATVTVDTTGYKNIQVSWTQYKYLSGGWGSSCELRVYANDTQLMDETSPYQIIGYRHYNLDSSFDNSVFNLKFSGYTGSSDYIIIDDILVTGEIIPYKPVINNYGYTENASTNSYVCIWVNAHGKHADNVSYAIAKVTSPSGKTFDVMLTDSGKCSVRQNKLNDNIYAGEFYIGDEDGNYKLDTITVYPLTGDTKIKTVNKKIQVYKPKIYYTFNLTDNQMSGYFNGNYTANLTVCSDYSYDKDINEVFIDIPGNIYVNGYIYNNTDYKTQLKLYNNGHRQFILKDVKLQPYSCINYTVAYLPDPMMITYLDNMNNYYNTLYNMAYNYWSNYLNSYPENTTVYNILNNMNSRITIFNSTIKDINEHPSHIQRYNLNELYITGNKIEQQFDTIFNMYNYRKMLEAKDNLHNEIYQKIDNQTLHIDTELQQMNTTINQINKTVNQINQSEVISTELLNSILNNTIYIKNNTVNILNDVQSLNQSDEYRYEQILNNINTQSNDIINKIIELEDSLGYNQSTETLRSDVLQIQDKLINLQDQYNQLYQLTQYINQTTTENNNKLDLIISGIQNSTLLAVQMNNTINNMNNKLDYINLTTYNINNDTETIINYVNQIKAQNNNIIQLINTLNQSEQNRFIAIINDINDKSNSIEQMIQEFETALGYNSSTDTLRNDIQTIHSYVNDIYNLENNLYALVQQVRITVNQVNITANNINGNLTSEINILKQMYNCSYQATNSICYKLDSLRADILNMNQSNINSIILVRQDISNINNTLGCNNGTVNKECILLQNINRKLPNVGQHNLTGLPTISQKLSSISGRFSNVNLKGIDLSSIIDNIKTTLLSIVDKLESYIGGLI